MAGFCHAQAIDAGRRNYGIGAFVYQALAELCPSIDKVLVDCGKKADKQSKKQLVADIKAQGFDASICLFSDSYNATLVWKAGIPFRLAPATKISQFLYNHRITQRRSQSAKPEFEYNLDLIRAFLAKQSVPVKEPCAPYLTFSAEVLNEQKTKLAGALGLDEQKPWLYVHAGSGGSANNLSLEQYCALVAGICEKSAIEVVLTAGLVKQRKRPSYKLCWHKTALRRWCMTRTTG